MTFLFLAFFAAGLLIGAGAMLVFFLTYIRKRIVAVAQEEFDYHRELRRMSMADRNTTRSAVAQLEGKSGTRVTQAKVSQRKISSRKV